VREIVPRAAVVIVMLIISTSFPYKIGYDCAGTVAEVGSDVSHLKVGDEVYTRLPEASRGMRLLLYPLPFLTVANL